MLLRPINNINRWDNPSYRRAVVGYTLDKESPIRLTCMSLDYGGRCEVTWENPQREERKAPAQNQTLTVLVTTSLCHLNKYHANLKSNNSTHPNNNSYVHVICIPLGERIRRSKPNEVKSEETELCLVISQKCMPFFFPPKLKAVLGSQTDNCSASLKWGGNGCAAAPTHPTIYSQRVWAGISCCSWHWV